VPGVGKVMMSYGRCVNRSDCGCQRLPPERRL